ncbi:MAG: universal stress protein [Desulfatirhabdiaceae bacterium]
MEHILVSRDIRESVNLSCSVFKREMTGGFLEAVYHAIHLAERIGATVDLLLVLNPGSGLSSVNPLIDLETLARKHLELLIEKARSNGVNVRCHSTIGNFEEEVIRFITDNKISLLILGMPDAASGSAETFKDVLLKIGQNVPCTIELVRRKEPSSRR